MESVRRDGSLSPMARLVADTLVLEFANRETHRCDPSRRQLADIHACSEDTIKRVIKELIDADWIVVLAGVGRGNNTQFGFLTRAKIVLLKGGKSAPSKGGRNTPLSASQKGADLHGKGGKSALVHNIDKPQVNQRGREAKISPNPMVHREAEMAVARWQQGRADALADLQPWVIDHIIAAKLLTDAERAAAGLG
tara:strand:- start:48619 stop:49203 length:585 start_codon:yes stop_codon:yes gene_type:complete